MKVKVLGSSCTWFIRNNTSFVIDENMAFDLPTGNYKLLMSYTNTMDLKSVFITHFHSDHFGDFRVFATEFMRQFDKVGRKDNLRVYAPKGILNQIIELNKLFYAAPDELDAESLSRHIDFIELYDGYEFEEGGYKVKAYKMEHGRVETYGFTFLGLNGKTIAFSADTVVCDNLHKMLSVSDYAFVEMAATSPNKTHINTQEFLELTKKYNKTKLFPVHTSDVCQKFAIEHGLNVVNDGDIFDF